MAKRGRCNGSRFVVTRRILTNEFQAAKIDKSMEVANRLYNMGVAYYKPIVEALLTDPVFQDILNRYHKWYEAHPDTEEGDKKAANPYAKDISPWLTALELNEYDLHGWFGATDRKHFPKCLNIDIVQKLATNLYSAIKKVIFSSGKSIHFRKRGETNTLEGKANNNAIIYHAKDDSVGFGKTKLKLKPVRSKDYYLQEAMASGKPKYCRIVRKPFKNGYHYFLQIVMEGNAPEKFKVTSGVTAQDPGTSNSTFYGDNYCDYVLLAKGCEKYERNVRKAAVKYERRRRMANPDNYNPDGTVKRGVKLRWKWTKGIWKALFELKDAYRQQAAHVKNYNGWLSNRVVRITSVLHQEKMDYRALAKRAKGPAQRQEKLSTIKDKHGKTKQIHKFKKKRRFGRSILRRSPGTFDKMLRDKVRRYGGVVIVHDPRRTASSQTDHITGERTKIDLSQRTKVVGGQIVQRDFYSSFINRHSRCDDTLDREACMKDFSRFLKMQEELVEKVRQAGDQTGNFGLADFDKLASARQAS